MKHVGRVLSYLYSRAAQEVTLCCCKKCYFLALVGIVLLALLAACSGQVSSSVSNTKAPQTAANKTRTVRHAMGETEITCTPQRVVTLGQGATDSLLALGVKPVGVVDPWGGAWYAYLADQIDGITSVGSETEPNLEAIVALKPDLILGSKLRHEMIYDQLSEIAPTVFAETIGRAWKENLSLYAEAACLEAEGAALLAAWEARIANFKEKMGDKLAIEVSLVRFRTDEVRIYTTGFPGSVLHEAGLARPEAQYFPIETWTEAPQVINLSKEQIPMMDGDVMFYMVSDWDNTEGTQIQMDWTSEPLWQTLHVVQAGQTYPVNEQHWNLGGGIRAANRMLDDLYLFFLDEDVTAPSNNSRSADQADQIVEVVDTNGATVAIHDASRIITLGGPVTEIVFALGGGDQVVARDSSSSYPEAVNKLPDVGYQRQLSAEGVLALDPTLILATTEAGPPEAIEQLQNSGVDFLQLKSVETVDGVKTKIQGFARALGKEAEGETLIAAIDADLAAAQATADSYADTPRVMFIYARGAGSVSVAGTKTGAAAMIELAGGENAVTEYEGYKPLTAEAVVAAAPDVLLLFTDGLESIGGKAGLLALPGIAQTPAAEQDRIVALDGLFLLNFGPRMGEAAKELAEQIHAQP